MRSGILQYLLWGVLPQGLISVVEVPSHPSHCRGLGLASAFRWRFRIQARERERERERGPNQTSGPAPIGIEMVLTPPRHRDTYPRECCWSPFEPLSWGWGPTLAPPAARERGGDREGGRGLRGRERARESGWAKGRVEQRVGLIILAMVQDSSKLDAVETGCSGLHYIICSFII